MIATRHNERDDPPMPTASSVNREDQVSSPKLETRRTGVVFLSLIVATNFVPWMQLVERGIASTVSLSQSQSTLVIASCLAASLLVVATWLVGRRVSASFEQIARARDPGLLLELLAAGANLGLAAIVHGRAPGASFGSMLTWFSLAWYGLILPTGLAAAFFKGRASIPAPRF